MQIISCLGPGHASWLETVHVMLTAGKKESQPMTAAKGILSYVYRHMKEQTKIHESERHPQQIYM